MSLEETQIPLGLYKEWASGGKYLPNETHAELLEWRPGVNDRVAESSS